VAQVYRYIRVSTAVQRQQTKWVVFGATVTIIVGAGLIGPALLLPLASLNPTYVLLAEAASPLFAPIIPISVGMAVLRYRLWDIDTIINKTLVYGALTVILGALYAGLIIGSESLAGLISKQASQPAVLVISTLAIFVLFQPLRRRIQSIIDRGFYRRKYDAEKTLAAFSATLHSEVDLEQIHQQLLAVIQETMQPTQVSLWLRQPEQHSIEQTYHLEAHGQEATKPTAD
jgi:hypothetical protein